MLYSEEQVPSQQADWGKPVGSLGRALELYMETRSVTRTIRQLRAKVSRSGFYKWTGESGLP